MANEFKKNFSGIGRDLLDNVRSSVQGRIDEAVFEEKIIGIRNATAAMIEIGVEEDKIILMLQKYWDLRFSEAKVFVERQRLTKGE